MHGIADSSALKLSALRCEQITIGLSGACNECEGVSSTISRHVCRERRCECLFRRFIGAVVTFFLQHISWISARGMLSAVFDQLEGYCISKPVLLIHPDHQDQG